MAAPESLTAATAQDHFRSFAPLSARRLLVLAGIAMILAGMIFGDIFAVFVLHQNASGVGASLHSAAEAALAGDAGRVQTSFADVGAFLENRGTKVDTHVHLIGFGFLALLLALLQPWVDLSEIWLRRLAWLLVVGGVVLPVGVFLIHYVGLTYSPLQAIGWASIVADAGGLLVMIATAAFLYELVRHLMIRARTNIRDPLLSAPDGTARLLFAGGLFLVLVGFLHGAYYAGADLYRHEAADYNLISQIASGASAGKRVEVGRALQEYGSLQGEKAVNIAAHAHFAEFGLLAMLLGFFQPYVSLRHGWKRRWAGVLLFGSALLPACVLLEVKFGLLAGALADLGGLLVIVAGFAMWVGILRYTGALDAQIGRQA
jgi:hypothetical protein